MIHASRWSASNHLAALDALADPQHVVRAVRFSYAMLLRV